jgi:hypothetical protein
MTTLTQDDIVPMKELVMRRLRGLVSNHVVDQIEQAIEVKVWGNVVASSRHVVTDQVRDQIHEQHLNSR